MTLHTYSIKNACRMFNMVYNFFLLHSVVLSHSLFLPCVPACLIACMCMYVSKSWFSVLYEKTGRVCVEVISPNCNCLWVSQSWKVHTLAIGCGCFSGFSKDLVWALRDFCFDLSVWQHTLQQAKFPTAFSDDVWNWRGLDFFSIFFFSHHLQWESIKVKDSTFSISVIIFQVSNLYKVLLTLFQ